MGLDEEESSARISFQGSILYLQNHRPKQSHFSPCWSQYYIEVWCGFSTLNRRTDQSIRNLGSICNLLMTSAKYERRFSEGTRSLITKTTCPIIQGQSLGSTLSHLWRVLDHEGTLYIHSREDTLKVALPIEALRKEQLATRMDVEKRSATLDKELRDRRAQFEKRKHNFYKVSQTGDCAYETLT